MYNPKLTAKQYWLIFGIVILIILIPIIAILTIKQIKNGTNNSNFSSSINLSISK